VEWFGRRVPRNRRAKTAAPTNSTKPITKGFHSLRTIPTTEVAVPDNARSALVLKVNRDIGALRENKPDSVS
jgi:hypothetical protein